MNVKNAEKISDGLEDLSLQDCFTNVQDVNANINELPQHSFISKDIDAINVKNNIILNPIPGNLGVKFSNKIYDGRTGKTYKY